ncbi:MAG: prepilin-type N-terminal cleavage/methylation domain-containing protein, partial [Planctomycetota bacterium]
MSGASKSCGAAERAHLADVTPLDLFPGEPMTISPGQTSPRPSTAHHPGGFTLVELIVVIGIIALLLAILLPALSMARGKGVGLQCAANLRELGRAVIFYQDDNAGYVPRD